MSEATYMRRVECFGGPMDGRSVEVLTAVGLIVAIVAPPDAEDEQPRVPASIAQAAARYEIVAADIAVYVGGGR